MYNITTPQFWLAQIRVQPNTALIFNGSQFFTALIAGVLLAFGFQLLFTNLGVAALFSSLGKSSSKSDSAKASRLDREPSSLGNKIRKISVKLGLGTLVSVSLALFLASLLAVRLGLFVSPVSGAIVGLTIWATFFLLLVWLSSNRLSHSIAGIVNGATSGFQKILATATAAIGAQAANRQAVMTAEAAAAAVSKQFGTAIEPLKLRDRIETYFNSLKTPALNIEAIAADFERLIDGENLPELAVSDRLKKLDRQTLKDLISENSELSQQDIDRLATRLESVWKRKIDRPIQQRDRMAEFSDYIKSANREQLLGNDFSSKLDTLIAEVRQSNNGNNSPQNTNEQPQNENKQLLANVANNASNQFSQALTLGMNSLIGLVLGRSDLSQIDVDKIIDQLKGAKSHVGEQTDKIARVTGIKEARPDSTVKSEIEAFLLDTYPWEMKRDVLEREFKDVLYNPEADPESVAADLRQINKEDFADILRKKGIYYQREIESIAQLLDEVRLEVLSVAESAKERKQDLAIFKEVENYLLHTPKQDFTSTKIEQNFIPIVKNDELDYEQLSNRFAEFDRATFERILARRSDLEFTEATAIANDLEIARERALQATEEEENSAQIKVEVQWLRVESYLRESTPDKLDTRHLNKELKSILDELNMTGATRKARKTYFDRNALVTLLQDRPDLDRKQIDRIVSDVEKIWMPSESAPAKLVIKAKEQYEQAKSTLGDYLHKTENINPETIGRDLNQLLAESKTGFRTIKHLLAETDRETIVHFLAQRQDLSEEQINRIVDEVQATLKNLTTSSSNIAKQTQQRVQSYGDTVANYLRSTDREELNPEAIRRDIELLLHNPRVGVENLQQRLSHFDRQTLVALLSQRNDLSSEDVNRVIEQILAVRDRTLAQLQNVRQNIQIASDRLLAKIRAYLNRLQRPELNYESISEDLRRMFDDPKAGFEALRSRLTHFDRNTLVAILSSSPNISRADADHIIDRFEQTRERLLQKAERMQNDAKNQFEQVKLQAQKQAEETRKAAAIASWWLFCTALVSAIAAASAGAIGAID
ncbi:MAG: MFS transporter [Xenococcaceae cyanobacterium]